MNTEQILDFAKSNIDNYLQQQLESKAISQELYQKAKENVMKNLTFWMTDKTIEKLSPNITPGILDAINEGRWADIAEVFVDEIAFGTCGIRDRAALRAFESEDPSKDKDELDKFYKEGLDARILKGPKTVNNVILVFQTTGVAKYVNDKNLRSVVIGYDSRVNGRMFAELATKVFLAHGLEVYLFDEAAPYPELMFAVINLKSDLGFFISASHNDKRYNGYKVVGGNGMQFDIAERNNIYLNYIKQVKTSEIKFKELEDANEDELVFLGGNNFLTTGNYFDKKNKREIVNMHELHSNHVKQFILDKKLLREWASNVSVGYAAFHGSGRFAVPKLLKDLGFSKLRIVSSMQDLNGTFPLFKVWQQPDPGDVETMEVAIKEFIQEYGQDAFDELDIFMGTDPDADRTGLVVKVPEEQRKVYGGKSYTLLSADDAWSLLLWYRLLKESQLNGGKILDADKKFVAYTHVTTDAIGKLATKYGLGILKTWVGFAFLANSIKLIWENVLVSPQTSPEMVYETMNLDGRNTNILACEQSNGFSILGAPPTSPRLFGINGHVKDKDGTLAALLLAEVAAYAKSQGKSIVELIDENIYLDPQVGMFYNVLEPSPKYGQYEGLEGISEKIRVLKKALNLIEHVQNGNLTIGKLPVVSTTVYRTGKYDTLHNWKGYPDEGIRFYFDNSGLNHLTIRPSGTSQSFRFHVQLKAENVTRENLIEKKLELREKTRDIFSDIRKILGVKL